MPFVKGQSGNPSGRPKVDPKLREMARAKTKDAIKALSDIVKDKEAPPAARVSAASVLLDRGYGKAVQAMEHSGRDGAPLERPVINVTIGDTEPAPASEAGNGASLARH